MERALFVMAAEQAEYAAAIRHELHKIPETAMTEYETTKLIRRELDALGATYQDLGMETGCVALLTGTKPGAGQVTAIRADIDGLPIDDLCQKPYASVHAHKAHACGHDGHTACLLGTARALASRRDLFSGTVKLIFQPGEEGLIGAKKMLEGGVLKNPDVDSLVALHGQPAFKVGQIAVSKGVIMASSDMFTIRFLGKSAHASRPAEGINPLTAAAQAVLSLQQIVPAEVKTAEQAVISVCMLQAGTAHNIIPNEAVLLGTVRCLNESVRQGLEKSVKRVAQTAAEMYRCQCETAYVHGVPVLENDEETCSVLQRTAEKIAAEGDVVPLPAVLGSEDFAFYANALKRTGYFRIGCAEEENPPLLHNGVFDFNDKALVYGMAMEIGYVLAQNG